MSTDHRIFLASRSPRRRELLTQIGVRFDMLLFRTPPREDGAVDEACLPDEMPSDYVQRVARAKAEHGAGLIRERRLPRRPLLAADTTLDLDGEIIGKPRDALDAENILARLSGRTHRVLSAVAVNVDGRIEIALAASDVRFRTISAKEIRHYVQSGEPMDKAGAYAIQGRAAMFVSDIRGSYSGIVGLPLCETALLLQKFGFEF
jgi:septum formation protein